MGLMQTILEKMAAAPDQERPLFAGIQAAARSGQERGFPILEALGENRNALLGFGAGALGTGGSWGGGVSGYLAGSQIDRQHAQEDAASAEEAARREGLLAAMREAGLPQIAIDLAEAGAPELGLGLLEQEMMGGRERLQDVNDRWRYVDDGSFVFPELEEAPPEGPTLAEVGAVRDDFNQLTSQFRDVSAAYSRVQAAAADPSGAGDLALIFNYMKMLDPDSVVRESEFETAAATGDYGAQIQGFVNSIINGQHLAEEVRADFVDRAERLYAAAHSGYQQVAEYYSALASRNNMNPLDVVPDIEYLIPGASDPFEAPGFAAPGGLPEQPTTLTIPPVGLPGLGG